jgi:HlyD family secretion protein
MSLQSTLFRKVALERLSSPEQLDMLPQAVTAPGWMALSALGALLCGALVWGWFGEIPTKIEGKCVLLNPSGVADVWSGTGGRVVDVLVKVGDHVAAQQPIARVAQPELTDQMDKAQARVRELEQVLATQQKFHRRGSGLNAQLENQMRQNLEAQRKVAAERARIARERAAAQKQLLDQGLVTQQALLATRQEQAAAELEVQSLDNQIAQLALRRLENEKQDSQERTMAEHQLLEARRLEDSLRLRLGEQALVVSPHAGRVIEIKAGPGMQIAPGVALASIEMPRREKGLEAVIYVPAGDGKKIRPGMQAQVTPSTARREEDGFMLANVSYVGEYPASSQNVMLVLQNELLARELAGDGLPIEVRARLAAGMDGRYKWSSQAGTRRDVRPGTLCRADVIVERQRPLALVLPTLKKKLGLD